MTSAVAQPVCAQTAPALTVTSAAISLPTRFDLKRDAVQGKRVLVDASGQWCHMLDRFNTANADVRRLRDAHDMGVKVSHSPDNHDNHDKPKVSASLKTDDFEAGN